MLPDSIIADHRPVNHCCTSGPLLNHTRVVQYFWAYFCVLGSTALCDPESTACLLNIFYCSEH